jgi:hydrogenase/urease accessory protein HupE
VNSTITFHCDEKISDFTLRYDLFTRIHPGHRLLASIRAGEVETAHVFLTNPEQPAEYTVAVQGPAQPFVTVLAEFVALGVRHIFTGYDHLLFLFALIVVGRSLTELITIATAFTVAHSVTLALAALQVFTLSPTIVEPAIALSIVAVATENLVLRHQLVRWRAGVTFVFGLVHGFGFASVLAEMDIGRESTLSSLIGFNLGVEIGQVVIVALIYPGLRWLRHQTFRDQAVRGVSGVILLIGIWWLGERVAGIVS